MGKWFASPTNDHGRSPIKVRAGAECLFLVTSRRTRPALRRTFTTMRKLWLGLIILLTSLNPALADSVTVSDADGDTNAIDIAEVSHHHYRRLDGAWRLRHTITTHDAWMSRDLRGSGIAIHIRRTSRSVVIYFKHGLKARVDRFDRETNKRTTIGRPPVWREDDRTVTVSLKRRLLGDIGDGYGWYATSFWAPRCRERTAACPATVDRAPDKGYIRHNL